VTIKAAAQQTSGVNAAMAYGTDGPVAALGLQTLSDPQGVQPIYAPTPVVREAVLKAYPQIAQWLQPVFASLDEKTLQQLNASIAVEGLDAKKLPQIICSKRAAEVDYWWLFAVITAYRCCWPVCCCWWWLCRSSTMRLTVCSPGRDAGFGNSRRG
jgi:hypothetical protein